MTTGAALDLEALDLRERRLEPRKRSAPVHEADRQGRRLSWRFVVQSSAESPPPTNHAALVAKALFGLTK
jgi:hypothetical protein